MSKSGPLNQSLHDIVEIDQQLRALVAGAVVDLCAVKADYRRLKSARRDKVLLLQHAGRDL